jgi:cytoskeleton protein RodZ
LVELPEDEIVADFHPYEPEPEEFRTLSAHAVVKPGASLPNFVLWSMLVFVLLVGAGYLLLGDDEDPGSLSGIDDQSADFSEPSLIEEDETIVAEQAQNAASATAAPDSDGVSSSKTSGIGRPSIDADFVAAEEPIEEEDTVGEVVEAIEPPVADEVPPALLTIRFSEECWVEISDSKRRLLYGLEKPGSEVDLQGTPPFKLFIGNISAVDIEVAGRPYTIPQSGRRGGNTARFSIAKDSF